MGRALVKAIVIASLLMATTVSSVEAQACQEQNGIVVMEIERVAPTGQWVSQTSIPGYTGSKYYRWNGPDLFFKSQAGQGKLTYNFNINSAGNYQLLIHSRIAHGNNVAEHNDVWVRMSGQPISGQFTIPRNEWVKSYQNSLHNWTFATRTKDHDPKPIRQRFSAGNHTIELSGRSFGFAVDRIILFKYDNYNFEECNGNTGCHANQGSKYSNAKALNQTCGGGGGNPPPPECSSNSDCNDGNPCTNDVCNSGSCNNSNKSNGVFCNDGDGIDCTGECSSGSCQPIDRCTGGQSCNPNNGQCQATAECSSNSDCNDGNPCTNDVCNSGSCNNPNKSNGVFCNDGDGIACTGECSSGSCQPIDRCTGGESCNANTNSCEPDGGGSGELCQEQNGIVALEVESAPPAGQWVSETSIGGYTGSEYYRWNGADLYQKSQAGQGKLTYDFQINSAGNYQLLIHGRITTGNSQGLHNDVWVRMSGQPIAGQFPIATNDWIKAAQNVLGQWSFSTRENSSGSKPIRQFFSTGTHKIELSGRSSDFAIDRIVLFKYGNYNYEECNLNTGCHANQGSKYNAVKALTPSCDGGLPSGCTSNADCADGNPCTNDRCNSGSCTNPNKANGAACSDGIACTADQCVAGVCQGSDSCPSGMSCDLSSGSCSPGGSTDLLCFGATSGQLNGQMTTGSAYTNGNDTDPARNSFFNRMLFSAASQNDFVGNNNDRAVYTVNLPSSGQWYLWGRFYYPGQFNSEDANSFFANIDNKSVQRFGNDQAHFKEFHWDGRDTGNAKPVSPIALGSLSAGNHKLTVRRREVKNHHVANAPLLPPRLDAICLSKSSSLVITDAIALDAMNGTNTLRAFANASCLPLSCDDIIAECGVFDDQCGGTFDCGSCGAAQSCEPTPEGQLCLPE